MTYTRFSQGMWLSPGFHNVYDVHQVFTKYVTFTRFSQGVWLHQVFTSLLFFFWFVCRSFPCFHHQRLFAALLLTLQSKEWVGSEGKHFSVSTHSCMHTFLSLMFLLPSSTLACCTAVDTTLSLALACTPFCRDVFTFPIQLRPHLPAVNVLALLINDCVLHCCWQYRQKSVVEAKASTLASAHSTACTLFCR